MSFLHLGLFLMFLFGFLWGRDNSLNPISPCECPPMIVYGWAFVGVFNWIGLSIGDLSL